MITNKPKLICHDTGEPCDLCAGIASEPCGDAKPADRCDGCRRVGVVNCLACIEAGTPGDKPKEPPKPTKPAPGHTPGPWHSEPPTSERRPDVFATVYTVGRGFPTCVREIRAEGYKNSDADGNARLIAASPSLYAAACAVLDNWERGDLAAAVRELAAVLEEIKP